MTELTRRQQFALITFRARHMKNLSISSKGLLSYSLMAATGVVVCLFMFLSADGANDSVKRYEKVNASVVANQVLKAEISYQATSLKNFMLSGDRKWVGEVDKAADVINATFETLNQQLQAGGASQTASLSQLRGEWDAWYREYALQQIDYMRNSRTVELAKAIEATGEGDRSLQVVYDTHARVRGLLAEELKTLASEQAEKLALMKNVAVFGGADVSDVRRHFRMDQLRACGKADQTAGQIHRQSCQGKYFGGPLQRRPQG
ncbi:MAG: CHASE3 domain-containing protein [Alphaproteobacteria bacterium]|nr:CHASE3 domain-containing protein [Alphaproteobacteria bacterium]